MTLSDAPARVRVAPSPTGDPHVGTAYIALFNLCYARKTGGQFVLRIEDTDRARSTPESEQAIFDALHWLGLDYDEGPDVGGPHGPYRQSERLDIYEAEIQKLIGSGHAYVCFCSAERLTEVRAKQRALKQSMRYDRHCRDMDPSEAARRVAAGETHVVRLAVPIDGETTFTDRLRGPITFANTEIDDQVLLKSDGFPTYHLASVVDDHRMGITHVCRAEEWITSTPKHVLLYEAFGWQMPEFIHVSLLRNTDKSKISKRKNPTSLGWYREQGYLGEALLNFLGNMGYSMPDGREIFSFDEMVADFSWDRLTTTGPVFDLEKLAWLNGEYLRAMSPEEFARRAREAGVVPEEFAEEKFLAAAPMFQQRVKTFAELPDHTEYFLREQTYEADDLLPRKKPGRPPTRTAEEATAVLKGVIACLESATDWTASGMEDALRAFCETCLWKTRELFMTLRVAVTGRTVSTPLFETMEILGRQESMARLAHAVEKLI
jgi:glutamyl-tRNA synthetase